MISSGPPSSASIVACSSEGAKVNSAFMKTPPSGRDSKKNLWFGAKGG